MSKEFIHKFEISTHQYNETTLIKDTEAGRIIRIPINGKYGDGLDNFIVPDFLDKITRTRHNRKQFMTTMNWNSRIGPRWLGKPNSAYFICINDKYYVDYLEENADFDRSNTSRLHNIMNTYVDYKSFNRINGNCCALSGHIAPLQVTTDQIASLMTFDAFQGAGAIKTMDPNFRKIVNLMYRSRLIPITSDGYLIK